MKTKTFVKGAIILTLGGIFSKILGAIYRVPLSNILGAEGIGIYQLIFPIYALVLVFITGGLSVAQARLIATARSRSNYTKIKHIFTSGFILMFTTGLILSLFMFFLSDIIATMLGNINASEGLKVISFAILFSALIASFRGYYQGFENMVPTATSQILEQFIKLILGLTFANIFIKNGIVYGVVGALLGVFLSEVISLLYLFSYSLIKRGNKNKESKMTFDKSKNTSLFQTMFELFRLSIPIMLGLIVLPLTIALDSLLVVNILNSSGFTTIEATSLFGLQSGMINSLVNFPTIVSLALATALVPSLSYSQSRKSKKIINNKIHDAFKIVYIVILPATIGIGLLAPNIMSLLYPTLSNQIGFYQFSINLLRISSISIFYLAFLQVTTAVLQGLGKIYIPVINLLLGCVFKISLTLILVRITSINILGSALASILCYTLATLLNLLFLRRYTNFVLNSKEVIIPLAINVGLAFVIFITNSILTRFLSILFATILTISLAVIFYFSALMVFKVYTKNELHSLIKNEKNQVQI